jgi:glutathione S-transferase
MMKLYYAKSACSLTVRIIINELGLESAFEQVDLTTKKTESGKDYLSINPKGAVPALDINDKGEILTENAVILQYLADSSKAYSLLPAIGDFKRYRVLEWLNFVATECHKKIGILFLPSITAELKNGVIMPMIKEKLGFINSHLQNNEYLLGQDFTLPDAYLFVVLRWAYYFKLDLSTWPNILRYMETLNQRPSIVLSLKQE